MKTIQHFITAIECFPYRPTWMLDSVADSEG